MLKPPKSALVSSFSIFLYLGVTWGSLKVLTLGFSHTYQTL